MPQHQMKSVTDKKLNRFSTITEIIVNVGTIGSWVLGLGSAYVLNIQKSPVVVPGINFVLDENFQFALVVCAFLAYIHFLQIYWERNREKLHLSNIFLDFIFWDLARLKQPLLLIPIVMASAISLQVLTYSYWQQCVIAPLLFAGLLIFFYRLRYNLSPQRQYEQLLDQWADDQDWKDMWNRRIKAKIEKYGSVTAGDFSEVGSNLKKGKHLLEIEAALAYYFQRNEFEQDLILTKTSQLNYHHPDHTLFDTDDQTILLTREYSKHRKETANS